MAKPCKTKWHFGSEKDQRSKIYENIETVVVGCAFEFGIQLQILSMNKFPGISVGVFIRLATAY